jgi:hypothetical protein
MASQSMLVDGIEVEAGWCHIELTSEEYIQPWMMLETDFESTHRQVGSHRSKGVFLLCMWLGLEAFYGGTDPFTYLLCSCLSGRLRQCNAQNFIELHAKIKTQQPLFVSGLMRWKAPSLTQL